MKQRNRRRQEPLPKNSLGSPSPAPEPSTPTWSGRDKFWLTVTLVAAVVVAILSYRLWTRSNTGQEESQLVQINHAEITEPPAPVDSGSAPKDRPAPIVKEKNSADTFLDEFETESHAEKEKSATALSNEELEKEYQSLADISTQIEALKKRSTTPGALQDDKEFEQALANRDRLLDQFNRKASSFEKDIGLARQARPDDAVVRWLTGELLMLVGGEPEEIAPHLKFAIAHGLKRPHLLGSAALVELRANQFADAHRSAVRAMDQFGRDRYLWTVFTRTAFSMNQFEQVLERLEQAFPTGLPAWAKAIQHDAGDLQSKWATEEKIRSAEKQADDLPRVRLLIEHRHFAKDASGKPLTTIETSGQEEVILELFENEAPATVANFLDLVARGFYNKTTFHLALPATMIAGGDPNTKNNDPADDGAGGPGYVIPDEFESPKVRNHFRGSVSMVNTGPHTAGSQFFLTLAPLPEMNGHFTVFGRVLKGQEAVDRITRGRTTRALGHYGKIIPGDLLVSAEVLRKRPHEYKVLKEQP